MAVRAREATLFFSDAAGVWPRRVRWVLVVLASFALVLSSADWAVAAPSPSGLPTGGGDAGAGGVG